MTQPIGNAQQTTAESWEIGAALINSQAAIRVVFKDENNIYHTVNAPISQVILDGMTDAIVLSGEIVEPQPVV